MVKASQLVSSGMGELIVRRARGWFGLLRNYRVLVDGEERARIGSGGSVRLQVPDGPVAVQARVDRRGSMPWRGVVGGEPTKLLVRNLDSVGAIVRPDDQLEIVPDTDPATPSPRVDVVRRRRHFFWWYGAMLASAIAYLTLMFVWKQGGLESWRSRLGGDPVEDVRFRRHISRQATHLQHEPHQVGPEKGVPYLVSFTVGSHPTMKPAERSP